MNIFWTIVAMIFGLEWDATSFFASFPQMQMFLLVAGSSVAVLLVGIVRSRRKPGPAPESDKKLGAIGAGPVPAAEAECDFAEFYMDLAKRGDFSTEQASALYRLSRRVRELQVEGELMPLDGE